MPFFDEVKKGNSKSIVGESYDYKDNVKTNRDMGMNSKGSLSQLGKNVSGMLDYTGFLVTGKGASYSGDAGGNAFLLQTGAKCKESTTGESATRQIYVNNTVQLPGGLKGLIPGVIEDTGKVAKAPMNLFGSFLGPNPQKCQSVTLKTRNNNNVKGTDTGILTENDIKHISACSFADGKNPITGKTCRDGFSVLYDTIDENNDISKLPDDYIVQFFYGSVTALALYMLYKLNNR